MKESTLRPEPYVGVSGVVSPDQQHEIESYVAEMGLTQRRLLLGVKAVHKTQFLDIENKYGQAWYPVGPDAFNKALAPKTENTTSLAIAQTYLDQDMVENAGYRELFMDRLLQRGGPWIDGIQFDMLPWHSDSKMLHFLENLKQRTGTKILLQVHQPAMDKLTPSEAASMLGDFGNSLDYVLFDASHGTGKRLNTAALTDYLSAVYEEKTIANTGFAIAGGLNETAVREDLPEVIDKFPDVSWDAEGQLHPIVPHDSERPLDMSIVRAYLEASRRVIVTSEQA